MKFYGSTFSIFLPQNWSRDQLIDEKWLKDLKSSTYNWTVVMHKSVQNS